MEGEDESKKFRKKSAKKSDQDIILEESSENLPTEGEHKLEKGREPSKAEIIEPVMLDPQIEEDSAEKTNKSRTASTGPKSPLKTSKAPSRKVSQTDKDTELPITEEILLNSQKKSGNVEPEFLEVGNEKGSGAESKSPSPEGKSIGKTSRVQTPDGKSAIEFKTTSPDGKSVNEVKVPHSPDGKSAELKSLHPSPQNKSTLELKTPHRSTEVKSGNEVKTTPHSPEGKSVGEMKTTPHTPEGKSADEMKATPHSPDGKSVGEVKHNLSDLKNLADSKTGFPDHEEGKNFAAAPGGVEPEGAKHIESSEDALGGEKGHEKSVEKHTASPTKTIQKPDSSTVHGQGKMLESPNAQGANNFPCATSLLQKRSPFIHNPPQPEERRARIQGPRTPREYIINLREDLADFQESHGLPRTRDYSFLSLGLALAQETGRALYSVFLMFTELFPILAIVSLILRFALDKLIEILETPETVPRVKKSVIFGLEMLAIMIPLWILVGTIIIPLLSLLLSIFSKMLRIRGGKRKHVKSKTKVAVDSCSLY